MKTEELISYLEKFPGQEVMVNIEGQDTDCPIKGITILPLAETLVILGTE